jgi:hypothetical protein
MFGACRRGPWQVVALKRFDKQPGVVLLFRDAGRFLPPVTSDLDPWSKQLACRPGAVSFTWFHDGGVSQLTCTPKGCGREDSKPLGLRGKVDKLAIADLDGTVVLASVRSTTTPLMSVTRALLLRTGSVSEIALAPERVVIGDEHHDGVGQLYSGLGLVQGAGVGVLLFHHGDDIAMLRVDRTGKVTPLTPVPLAAQ